MEQLLNLLASIYPLSERLETHLRGIIKLAVYKKGAVILPAGEVCNHIFFIETGLVRSFYAVDGKEVSNWFMKEGDICISVLSFLRRIPSFETHIALEACRCWGITYVELEEVYRLQPEFNIHGRIITGEYYCRSEERQIDIKLRTPAERYKKLMEKDPGLILRVQNNDLASFLGVRPRTLDNMKRAFKEIKRPGQRPG